jgi:hypothetical protein
MVQWTSKEDCTMTTGKPRDLSKEQFWRRMLRRQQRSGLSVRAFCRQHNLSQPSFYAWRRTIAQRDAQLPAFVPLEILPEPLPLPTAAATGCGLELVLGRGRIVRIGPAFDAPSLRRLLALLEEGQP